MAHWRSWRRALVATVAGGLALALAPLGAAAETVCAATGEPAPAVPTLRASKTNPAKDAWLVAPDCSYQVIKGSVASRGDLWLIPGNIVVDRIASLPTDIEVVLIETGLSRGGDFSGAPNLKSIQISSNTISVKDVIWPTSLEVIQLENAPAEGVDSMKLPNDLRYLYITNCQLLSLKKLQIPATITSLGFEGNKLTEIDFTLPPLVKNLQLTGNPISKLEDIVLPSSLRDFGCKDCGITSIKGLRLPDSFVVMELGFSQTITTFEIRESDIPRIKSLSSYPFGLVNQTTCSDPSAKLVEIQVVWKPFNVCVISDTRFDELYGAEVAPPVTSLPSATGSGAMTSSPGSTAAPGDAGASRPIGDSNTATRRPTTGEATTSADVSSAQERQNPNSSSLSALNQTSSSIAGGSANRAISPTDVSISAKNGSTVSGLTTTTTQPGRTESSDAGGDDAASKSRTATASVSKTLVLALGIVGSAFVLLALAVGYRAAVIRREKKADSEMTNTDTYSNLETPLPSSHQLTEPREPAVASQEYLENDIRNDMLLANSRIDGSAIKLGAPIAQGGFGVIYKGVVDGETVAIKKMLPETWRDEATVTSFMDEIRMCVSLDHQKIVQCIGISWTSLRDLAVVIEYMDGGDLHSTLEVQSQSGLPITGREWSEPWTASGIKSKTSIATDVADALAYLHAFHKPIIHRDLKAKNVLLDAEGNAKLSDFGISREVSVDETMTREVGTVAWIAPEVLRGERYSEQADIYSFGVLLVEMDRCSHPYAQETVVGPSDTSASSSSVGKGSVASGAIAKNTKIAILVSTGRLHPTPTASCPDAVKQLIERCLSYDAAGRPSAAEVQEMLHRLHANGEVQPKDSPEDRY